MKYFIENMGPVRYAEYSLDSFNIVCGLNNTGKTYVTYSLFGFLSGWEGIFDFMEVCEELDSNPVGLMEVLRAGESKVDIEKYFYGSNDAPSEASFMQNILNRLCQIYSGGLGAIFAANDAKFTNSSLSAQLDEKDIEEVRKSSWKLTVNIPVLEGNGHDEGYLSVVADKIEGEMFVNLRPKEFIDDRLSVVLNYSPEDIDLLDKKISIAFIRCILRSIFPRPYVSSAERTGVATFREDLAFARQKLVSLVSNKVNRGDSRNRTLRDSLFVNDETVDPKFDFEYPSAVQSNIDFMAKLEAVIRKDSYIYREYENILKYFLEISEGEYKYSGSSVGYFLPRGRNKRLTLDEVSSSVRALADLWFYLRYYARQGDLLIIDEPELNLHPKNQRLMARLLAMVSRAGIKVLITTHSEYILKEINYLIRMYSVWDEISEGGSSVLSGYEENMLLKWENVNVCVTGKNSILIPGMKRRSKVNTLSAVKVNEYGIKMESFDNVIEDMNRLEDYIYWGIE
ncbi:AAA family ATPase [Rothia mucilaginosa]